MFYWNLLLVAVEGVLVSLWLTQFTDWFLTFAGLVSLGGGLSVVAALLKILPEDRVKGLQAAIDETVFDQAWTAKVFGISILATLVAMPLFGTLEITPPRDSESVVRIDGDNELIHVEKAQRFPFFVGRSGRTVSVKALGYPAATFTVGRFFPTTLRVPDSFYRRLVLVRPSLACAENTGANPRKLTVSTTRGGKPISEATVNDYAGETLWLSADTELTVPPQLIEKWRAQFQDREVLVGLWRHPRNLPSMSEPGPGTSIKISVDGGCQGVGVAVNQLANPSEYVQEVILP